MKKISDIQWMKLAISEAKKALGQTSPNPMVGAVLVKNNRLLAKAYHRRAGLPHAEIEAFKKTKQLRGATLYVSLEPCCHQQKRTPPCVDAIIQSGVKHVVVGCFDPNPKVRGRGIKKLRQAGIKVKVGVLKKECEEINRFYNHWIVNQIPYVIFKCAMSLDGKIALANGQSQWITSAKARRRVHELRSQVDGILTGVNTVKCDNPQLTARGVKAKRQPVRIVLDPDLEISQQAKVLSLKKEERCFVVTAPKNLQKSKAQVLQKRKIELLACPQLSSGEFKLNTLLKLLGKHEITSMIIEGGPGVWTSFVQQKCFQELQLFLAPKFLGGDARSLLNVMKLKALPQKQGLSFVSSEVLGPDVLLIYR